MYIYLILLFLYIYMKGWGAFCLETKSTRGAFRLARFIGEKECVAKILIINLRITIVEIRKGGDKTQKLD